MNIKIVCVGKIKEKFYRDAVAEYEKRLSRYCKLQIVEVADEKTADHCSQTESLQVREKEANRLLSHIKDTEYVIALAIEGKAPDSPGLARQLEQLALNGKSSLVFVIGGSLGLHPTVMERADEAISFSAMTFPHQLMRVILLEQIYRSYRILNNEPYHK